MHDKEFFYNGEDNGFRTNVNDFNHNFNLVVTQHSSGRIRDIVYKRCLAVFHIITNCKYMDWKNENFHLIKIKNKFLVDAERYMTISDENHEKKGFVDELKIMIKAIKRNKEIYDNAKAPAYNPKSNPKLSVSEEPPKATNQAESKSPCCSYCNLF